MEGIKIDNTFKFHVAKEQRHYNGVIVKKIFKPLEYFEDFQLFHVVIREHDQISSYMTGFACSLYSLVYDGEFDEPLYAYIDSECDDAEAMSDAFLFAKEHTEYLRENFSPDMLIDSYFICIIDTYVAKGKRAKGYLSAMLDGLYKHYGLDNICVACISDFDVDLSIIKDIKNITQKDFQNIYRPSSFRQSKEQLNINMQIAAKKGFVVDTSWQPSATDGCIFAIKDSFLF